MKIILLSSILVFSVGLDATTLITPSPSPPLQPEVNEDSSELMWKSGPNYRPAHFTLPIYKATVLDNNSIEIMDGPIILENGRDGMYFVITSDNYADYAMHPDQTNSTENIQINIDLTSTEPISREFDVIVIEALDEDLIPVSRTTVLIFNSNKEFDMYKMKFKIDDSEYIVLNYYYFKWFLGLLTVTGLLILAIELHEIVKTVRNARENGRSRQYGKYQELLHI